ncbi:MAG: hypothetical protein ACP5JJ_12115, partial [Anaerolineae bacterium]
MRSRSPNPSQRDRRPVRWPVISVEHLWPLTVLIGIFIFLNTHPIRPHDFWWHMAVGRETVTTGRIATADTYSFTAQGTPYPSYQMFWLPEVVLYVVYTLGGPALIVLVHSLIVSASYALTLGLTYKLTQRWRMAALATLFAAALGINDWNVRPQAFTFWLAPLFLLAIHHYREKRQVRWLAVLPLGMVLWVNSHGTFILGFVLLGLWLAQEVWEIIAEKLDLTQAATHDYRRDLRLAVPAAALVMTAAASLITPQGLGIVTYVRTLTADPVVQSLVPEWAPPSVSTWEGRLFLVGFLGMVGVLAISPCRPTPFQLLSFLAFAGLGLTTARGVIWFGLVAAPTMAIHLSALAQQLLRPPKYGHRRQRAGLNVTIAGLLLLSACLTLPWFKASLPLPPAKAGLISSETPIEAADFLLEAKPPGPLFHAMP